MNLIIEMDGGWHLNDNTISGQTAEESKTIDNYKDEQARLHGSDLCFLDGSRRIPCSMYYDFLIRQNGKGEKVLHICYHQRSSDFVTHFGNDVYLAWRLMEYVAQEVGVKPGYLYHTIDSLHSYKKDWKYLNTNLEDLQDSF